MHQQRHFEVAIAGGGIIGTSLLYMLSKFSDVKDMLLLEKNNALAQESTNSRSNAQTLHIGDIETNYGMDKVTETRVSSMLIPKYASMLPRKERDRIIFPVRKMVLGVGEEEADFVDGRYDKKFVSMFPGIRKIGAKEISKIEPYLMRKRDPSQKVMAAMTPNGNMVCFNLLAESFAKTALRENRNARISLNEGLEALKERNGTFELTTHKGKYTADFVVLASGGYSLYFAKAMGYGENLSMLSVGGNFYYSKRVLNSKVYSVQKRGIPFAAVHGDPDLNHYNRTRYGPTVSVLPYLENPKDVLKGHHIRAFEEYLGAMGMDMRTVASLLNIGTNRDIMDILALNLAYSMPEIGKYIFVKEEVNRIVPSMRNKDVTFDTEAGGVRPQIIDKRKRELVLGVVELEADGLIFDMAPSPGASSCLKGALEDAIDVTNYLGKRFHKEGFCREFFKDEKSRSELFRSLRKPRK